MLSEYQTVQSGQRFNDVVLILVLMEYALWELENNSTNNLNLKSLNPCFNGICSLSMSQQKISPICCGVLILVLMEYALWEKEQEAKELWYKSVLILVLMEYALWVLQVGFDFTGYLWS